MPNVMEKVAVANSALRTLLATVVVGGLGLIGWRAYSTYNASGLAVEKAQRDLATAQQELAHQAVLLEEKDGTISSLRDDVERQRKEIDRLDTALRLLKVDRRIARLTVLDQQVQEETGHLLTRVEFQELNEEGAPVDAPKQFQIRGDVVYVDAWVVKFDDKYIEQAAIDRSTSLVLFRRVFGEQQQPADGFVLDESGMRPTIYGRGGSLSELEKKIWGDFWNVANDEARQAELGIRAAHGEAPSVKVQKGKSYRLELRASGGLSISPEGDAPIGKKPAA